MFFGLTCDFLQQSLLSVSKYHFSFFVFISHFSNFCASHQSASDNICQMSNVFPNQRDISRVQAAATRDMKKIPATCKTVYLLVQRDTNPDRFDLHKCCIHEAKRKLDSETCTQTIDEHDFTDNLLLAVLTSHKSDRTLNPEGCLVLMLAFPYLSTTITPASATTTTKSITPKHQKKKNNKKH